MLIFLDTQFTDFIDCDLISIGMVSGDDQREFYVERSDYQTQWCDRSSMLPCFSCLGGASPALDRQQLATQLTAWFATPPRSVTIACNSFTDWELLLDAMDGERPAYLGGRYNLRGHINSQSSIMPWSSTMNAKGHAVNGKYWRDRG